MKLNSSVDGKGMAYYLRGEPFPLPPDASGEVKYKQSGASSKDLFQDAYAQVFFSVGVCVGTMFAYGSYNKTKKPVIVDSIVICLLDFVYALLAGFIVWGAVGYLQVKGNIAYNQTSNVGLTFIAMPVAASVSESPGMFTTFCVMMFFAGIDSAFGFVEGLVANLIDQAALKRW
jgi:NSS family neurotransmitter:Na+ symporter